MEIAALISFAFLVVSWMAMPATSEQAVLKERMATARTVGAEA